MKSVESGSLERVWEARKRIFERCHNDVDELVRYYIQEQKRYPGVLSREQLRELANEEELTLREEPVPPSPEPDGDDPVIAEIRRVRRQMWEEAGGDMDKVLDYFFKKEEELRATGKVRFEGDPPKKQRNSKPE